MGELDSGAYSVTGPETDQSRIPLSSAFATLIPRSWQAGHQQVHPVRWCRGAKGEVLGCKKLVF